MIANLFLNKPSEQITQYIKQKTCVKYLNGKLKFFNIDSISGDVTNKLLTTQIDDIENAIEISVGSSVKNISNYAFYNCTNLTKLLIPETITSIDLNSFLNCVNLTTINIHKTKAEVLEIIKDKINFDISTTIVITCIDDTIKIQQTNNIVEEINKYALSQFGESWQNGEHTAFQFTNSDTQYDINVYNGCIPPEWVKFAQGGPMSAFNLTPRIRITSQHYNWYTNNRTWPSGGHLLSWARQAGFTEEQLNQMPMLEDVHVSINTTDLISQDKCPYLISPEVLQKISKTGSLSGAVCWKSIQYQIKNINNIIVCPFDILQKYNNDWRFPYNINSLDYLRANGGIASAELANIFENNIENTYYAYINDSGKPIWVYMPTRSGKVVPVLIAQFKSAQSGPDYIAAFDVIKQFAESQDQTINEYTLDMAPVEFR